MQQLAIVFWQDRDNKDYKGNGSPIPIENARDAVKAGNGTYPRIQHWIKKI